MRPVLKTTGAREVVGRLGRLAARARVLGVTSAHDVSTEVSRGWQRSLSRRGPGWPPLKASTVRERIREGYAPGPPLVRTGALKRGLDAPKVSSTASSQDFAIRVAHAVYPLSERPVKLDRLARQAITRTMSRRLHKG